MTRAKVTRVDELAKLAKEGEIVQTPEGDVVIGVPVARSDAKPPPDQEDEA